MVIRTEVKKEHGEPPRLERYEILDKIRMVDGGNPTRDKALIAFLYLTGCRISEVVRYKIEVNNRKTKVIKEEIAEGMTVKKTIPAPIKEAKIKGKPILAKQIELQKTHIIVRNVRSLKRKKYISRNIPIPLRKEEQPFINYFMAYYKTLHPDDPLFDISRQRSTQILESVGLFNHWLRHCRLTHLAVDYGMTEVQMQKFTGWKDGRQTQTYVHLNVKDLVEVMLK